ncbi:uncharacterized mitochondrial protein AtMg00810-like [Spinacia oleracea]|uniref:Uncharacterized mitochondrial protein AtMg00810-like n=1 Tax=Spinacia oleracea TaxID=3562 RepID=A0ABM3QYC0_SPIOL|nr:uncharacterized mitochondrial protein AtMg00810-like [Spinacia oleracea]
MKVLGYLKYFLGIEVPRSSSGLFLCQRKYTLDIISKPGLLCAKPCGFPIEHNHRLRLADAPRIEHWEVALRVVRYLKGTQGQGILLRVDIDLSLAGWYDSDWAACPITRRSLTFKWSSSYEELGIAAGVPGLDTVKAKAPRVNKIETNPPAIM